MPPWHGSMSRTPPEFLLARASTTKGMNGAETVSKDILGEKVQDPWLMLMQSSSTQQLLFTSTLNRPSNYVIKILLTTAFPWAAHYHHPKIVQSLNNRVGSSIRHGSTAAATAQIGAGQSLPSVQSDHSQDPSNHVLRHIPLSLFYSGRNQGSGSEMWHALPIASNTYLICKQIMPTCTTNFLKKITVMKNLTIPFSYQNKV